MLALLATVISKGNAAEGKWPVVVKTEQRAASALQLADISLIASSEGASAGVTFRF